MFIPANQRYIIKIGELVAARKKIGLSQTNFAKLCGWSPQYQWQLENCKKVSINENTKSVIERALNENTNNNR